MQDMRILISPMPVMARTAGPSSRAAALARACVAANVPTALCAASGVNDVRVEGVMRYPLDVPQPFGLPKALASRTYPLAEKLGIMGRKPVRSFEEVLHITGAITYPYLEKSVAQLRCAIADFKPSVVYSEFCIPAIVAARLEGVRLACSISYPALPGYASSPNYAKDINRFLAEHGMPQVRSCLDLIANADMRFVPSCPTLEPIEDDTAMFVGPFSHPSTHAASDMRDCLVVYMGVGTIAAKRLKNILVSAFASGKIDVFVAGCGVENKQVGAVNFAPRFDFDTLLPRACAFVNHGGQNSIMDGLLYGAPHIIYPGKVFERIYNARSVARCDAGITLDNTTFTPEGLREALITITSDNCFGANARKLQRELLDLGGAATVVAELRKQH